jgi:hypothetical protein
MPIEELSELSSKISILLERHEEILYLKNK